MASELTTDTTDSAIGERVGCGFPDRNRVSARLSEREATAGAHRSAGGLS
jgi:hypothetical protein